MTAQSCAHLLGGGDDMAKRKHSLPFDKRGGAIVMQRRLLESAAYLGLSLAARALLPLMQCQWRNEKPVDFSVREAARLLCCNPRTAMAAFDELQEAGFIALERESHFDTFTSQGSKARAWRLCWLPYRDKPPSNEWEKIEPPGALSATQM